MLARTGIIPEEHQTEDMSIEIEENNEMVVQSLLNQMDITDLMSNDYIDINSSLEATQAIDDNEIIDAVRDTIENNVQPFHIK